MQLVETIEQMDNNTGKWLVDFMKERDAELEEKLAFQEKKFEELLERKLKDGIEEVKQSMIRETINFLVDSGFLRDQVKEIASKAAGRVLR